MIAAKMANLPKGRPENTSNDVIQDDAAKLLSVSVPTLQRAKYVLEHGSKSAWPMRLMKHWKAVRLSRYARTQRRYSKLEYGR